MESAESTTQHRHEWPHSPLHQLSEAGAFMVTSGTYKKLPHFHSAERLQLLTEALLELATKYSWNLQAWAVFPNHYHFISESKQPQNLRKFISHLHTQTASAVNRLDDTAGKKIWFQYWETRITFQKSFLARLSYVHQNAVHHGLVPRASLYPWCSAGWIERKASAAFCRMVMRFPCDKVVVPDEFEAGGTGNDETRS
jgi:putative transposase